MIYISCVTDVCAGIALIYEAPEGAIMQVGKGPVGAWGGKNMKVDLTAPSCRARRATTAPRASLTSASCSTSTSSRA